MIRKAMIAGAALLLVAAAVTVQARQRPSLDSRAAISASAPSALRFSRVRLSTGVELDVAQSGPVDGQPVLFLHGFPDSWFTYSTVLEGLPANIRAVVPSQRGHGDSDRPECCYRIADFAADAVALLDALGIQRAAVVGHSMGSFVAQRLASDHPQRVDRLILVGSSARAASKPVVEFSQAVQSLTDPITLAFARDFQVSTAQKPVPPVFMDRIVAESMKLPARVWRAVMLGLTSPDGRTDLARVRASTLILWGKHDILFGAAEQSDLRQAMPNAGFVMYDDLGHSPHWEDPARVTADIARFLTQQSGATIHESQRE